MQHVNLRALRRGFSSRFAFDPAAHHARRNNQTTLNRATRDAGLPLTGTLATVGNALGGSPPHPKGIRGAVALPVYSLRRSCSPQRHVHIVRKPPPESQLAGGGSGRGGGGSSAGTQARRISTWTGFFSQLQVAPGENAFCGAHRRSAPPICLIVGGQISNFHRWFFSASGTGVPGPGIDSVPP